MAGKPDKVSAGRTASKVRQVAIAVALLAIMLLSAWLIYRWYAQSDREVATAQSNMSGMAEISAQQLTAEYDQDSIGAGIRYGNRPLRVSGRVHSIHAATEGPIVVLGGEDPLLTVTASFDRAQADQVAAMTMDSRLTVICTRTIVAANSPALQDCRLD